MSRLSYGDIACRKAEAICSGMGLFDALHNIAVKFEENARGKAGFRSCMGIASTTEGKAAFGRGGCHCNEIFG